MPRFMLRAVPTCTLWVPENYGDFWHFSLYPSWRISAIQVFNA